MNTPTIIITGASRGLGAATARILAEIGANVVLNARSVTDLENLAKEIRSEGGQVLVVVGDIGKEEDCNVLVTKTVENFGSINAIVNNAGIIEPIAPIASCSANDWQKNLIVNIMGPMMLTQAALPYLKKEKGRVINVSSGAALSVVPGWSAYSTAKAGLNHFTRVLAAEEPKITAISFRPGVVDTAMQAAIRKDGAEGMPKEKYARFLNLHADGALLPPEKPGRALALLALYAPLDFSGEFIQWDDERIEALRN